MMHYYSLRCYSRGRWVVSTTLRLLYLWEIPGTHCTGSRPPHCWIIIIKIQETSIFYQLTKGDRREEVLVDRDMEVTCWHHPADTINFLAESNEATGLIQIFTDGSKSEQRVGAGIAIFRSGNHFESLQYRLNKRCTKPG